MKQTILIGLILCLSACDLINPDEQIPAYVYVDAFDFAITPNQGGGTTRITEGYLFVESDFLGVYALPATIPILEEGETSIQVWPGVHDNGVAALPNIYPFYEIYQTTKDLMPAEVDTIRPSTAYKSDLNFLLEEFISTSNIFVNDLDGDVDTDIDNVIEEGQPVGEFMLNLDHPQLIDGTIIFNELPPRAREVYLEMEFKSDVDIAVGIQGFDGNGIRIFSAADRGARAQEDWTKIYFNLTDYISALYNSSSQQYLIFLQAILPIEQGEFALDEASGQFRNIKLISFN